MLRLPLTTPRLITLSFVGVILIGALLLLLPVSRAPGVVPITVVDAIFTATSATCVTGLTVRDTGRDFSFFGQAVIVMLCQIGGLGILTISNYFLFMTGRRLGLGGREMIEASHGSLREVHPRTLLRQVVVYTLTIEAIGAAILTARFAYDYPLPQAIWMGVFHAVSAFCNAGFGLLSDSFVSYSGDPVVNLTIMGLIILGGLGFVVFADLRATLPKIIRRQRFRLSLHSRIVLLFTALLIVVGAAMIVLFEFVNPVQSKTPLPVLTLQAFFLSVTARTAGFNTVDMAALTDASLLLVMILMVIGASPGSTGGGVKTTTLAVFYALVMSRLRARPTPELLDRSLPPEVVSKAVATLVGFMATVVVAVMMLGWTELAHAPNSQVRGRFLEFSFEVISATATAGLSMGITASLSTAGKYVLVLCMIFGRLGPLLVGASLLGRQRSVPYNYPKEGLIIG